MNPTQFHKGDVARYNYDGSEIVFSGIGHGGSLVFEIGDAHLGLTPDDVTLIRRATDPEFPSILPPLPEAKEDHRWVYRGMGWDSGYACIYMCYSKGCHYWDNVMVEPYVTAGQPGFHYAELVPNEPYTPPEATWADAIDLSRKMRKERNAAMGGPPEGVSITETDEGVVINWSAEVDALRARVEALENAVRNFLRVYAPKHPDPLWEDSKEELIKALAGKEAS